MASTGVKPEVGRATSPATWWPRWLWTVPQEDGSCFCGVICPQRFSLRAQVGPAAVPHPSPAAPVPTQPPPELCLGRGERGCLEWRQDAWLIKSLAKPQGPHGDCGWCGHRSELATCSGVYYRGDGRCGVDPGGCGGRGIPLRNLSVGTLEWPQEEAPQSLSYSLPQFLSYIYLPSWIREWFLSVLHSLHSWASPQTAPFQERWVRPPSPSGACKGGWGWGVIAWLSGETRVEICVGQGYRGRSRVLG